MALVAGTAPWREKYGMTVCNRFYNTIDNQVNSIVRLKFNFPTPNGYTSNVIGFYNNWMRIHVNTPQEALDGSYQYSSYYAIYCDDLSVSTNRFYIDNQSTGFRLRYETEKGTNTEITLLPNGNIQIKSNITSYNLWVKKYGFLVDSETIFDSYSSDGNYIIAKENNTYVLYEGYYDDSNSFAAASKIIDTVYIKNANGIRHYNVYSFSAGIDNTANQKFRVKTPNGSGYIYSKPTVSGDTGPFFYINDTKYTLFPCSQTTTPSTSYEYTYITTSEYTTSELTNNYVPNNGSYYWHSTERITLNTTYDVPIYNIYVRAGLDRYNSAMTTAYSTNICYHTNSSSWYQTGYANEGKGCEWFYALTEDPNSNFWSSGITNLSYFGFAPRAYGSSYYCWALPVNEIYFKIATTTVV